jgi:hypothetical protein
MKGEHWRVGFPPPFSIADRPKALLPFKREAGRDFWEGLFKSAEVFPIFYINTIFFKTGSCQFNRGLLTFRE